MTLTADLHAHFVDIAGDDFTYAGVRGGSRIPSTYLGVSGFRSKFRAMLGEAQGWVCPVCSDTMTPDDVLDGEVNHVVSQGPGKRGWFPGNVFLGHPACNTRCERTYGAVVPLHALRADLIPTDWVPFPMLARS